MQKDIPTAKTPETPNNGFNEIYNLSNDDPYQGNADHVILVWNGYQLIPAEGYRKANFPDETTDLAICEDPRIQREQIGDRAIIYNFGSGQQSSGGGGGR
ncbi:MAG: hypothetical protein LBM73_03385 [Candidatus Nomurabacteria bacterium]|jgi:hypothetical protein|nr:hypothetical protein [Candidatus Nomurabacteria bacterium]